MMDQVRYGDQDRDEAGRVVFVVSSYYLEVLAMKLRLVFLKARYPLFALAISWFAIPSAWADGGCPCEGDVTGDGFINVDDVAVILQCVLGNCAGCVNDCDVNCDGVVDLLDVSVLGCEGGTDCCNGPTGACRGAQPPLPGCVVTTQALCESLNVTGTYAGDGTNCDVPATSEWGLGVFTLLLLTVGTLLVRSRATAVAAA